MRDPARTGASKRRRLRVAAGASFFVLAVVLLLTGIFRPEYNWDVIGYVGAVNALGSDDTLQIHASTYAEIARVEGTLQYASAGPTDTPYRILMRASPRAFFETLRFYRSRVGYVWLVSALSLVGMNVVFATHVLSAFSVSAGVWILFLISRRLLPPGFQLIIPLAALLVGLPETARLSTPDGLAFALILLTVYLFLTERKALLFCAPVLVAVRPDLILFVFLLSVSCWMLQRPRRGSVVAALTCSLCVYFALHWYAGYPGWQQAFRFTFIDRLSPDAEGLGLQEYLYAVLRGGWGAVRSLPFMVFVASACGAVSFARRKGERAPVVLHVLGLSILFVALRMLVFPLPDARFFVAPYILTIVCWLALAGRAAELHSAGDDASTR